MGQYYKVVNPDKRQFLYPHQFGDGQKLLEFGASQCGTLTALAVLLADGNNRGGGDLHSNHPIIGTWAGDRIIVAGDYADAGRWLTDKQCKDFVKTTLQNEASEPDDDRNRWLTNRFKNEPGLRETFKPTLYAYAGLFYEDVSEQVKEALAEDEYLGYSPNEESFRKSVEWVADRYAPNRNEPKPIPFHLLQLQDVSSIIYCEKHKGRKYLNAYLKWLLKQPFNPAILAALPNAIKETIKENTPEGKKKAQLRRKGIKV